MRIPRIVASSVALALVFIGGVSVPAHAMTGEPWVPPSMHTDTQGLDVSALVYGGALDVNPLVKDGVPVDATTPPPNGGGSYCNYSVVSMVWTGESLTMVYGATDGPNNGDGTGMCASWNNQDIGASWRCVVTVGGNGLTAGSVLAASSNNLSDVVGGVANERVYSNICGTLKVYNPAASFLPYSMIRPGSSGTTGSVGWRTFNPAAAGLLAYVVSQVCDGVSSSASFALGVGMVMLPECAGVRTQLSVSAVGGTDPLTVSTIDPRMSRCGSWGGCVMVNSFGAGVCVSGAASCWFWPLDSVMGQCSIRDPNGDGWNLPSSDCDEARTHGYFPGPSDAPPPATLTPDPTVVPTGQPTTQVTVNVNVNVNVDHVHVAPDAQALGDCEPGGVSLFNPASWVVEPLKCLLIPSTAALGSLGAAICVDGANPSGEGGWCAQGRGKIGVYSDRVGEVQSYLAVPMPDCAGPAVPLSMLDHGSLVEVVKLYPLQACVDPGRTLAGISFAGTTILCYVIGFLGLFKVVGSALGVGLFNGDNKEDK